MNTIARMSTVLVIVYVLAMLIPSTGWTQPEWVKQLVADKTEGRAELSAEEAKSRRAERKGTVFMNHGTYRLDTLYMPELKGERRHVLIQFDGTVNTDLRESLESEGIELLF